MQFIRKRTLAEKTKDNHTIFVVPLGVGMLRGGGRNVEGVLGIPLLENKKIANDHIMFFDRYEISIHDCGDLI